MLIEADSLVKILKSIHKHNYSAVIYIVIVLIILLIILMKMETGFGM